MPRINGRSLEQVRRYDLFKLAVAVLLFIAWLFFTDRIPTAPAGAGSTESSGAAAQAGASPAATPASAPLRIESVDGRIRLRGSVPDEATRGEYVAAARKAAGRADRVDDGLSVLESAGRPGWLSHVGPAIAALLGHDGVSATIDAERVLLEGSVADEAQRTGIADEVTAAFGAPFTVVNQLAIAESVMAAGTAAASAPAQPQSSSGAAAAAPVASPAPTREQAPASAAAPVPAQAPAAQASATPAPMSGASSASSASAAATPAAAPAAPAPARAPAPAPAPAPVAASAASSSSSPAPALKIAPAPVSVFFEEGVTAAASGDEDKLAPLVRHAREAGGALRVSGFHSKTGSAQRNEEIAKQRAVSVRDMLVSLGVASDRIILDKPQETLGEEDDRRARRVDVSIDGR